MAVSDEQKKAQEDRERKAADEKRAAEVQGAKVGAQAVADAVSKVAAAAVAEAGKVSAKSTGPSDFNVTGSPGGRFRLEGPALSFGASGTVLFGDRQVQTDGWSAETIYGHLPADVKPNVDVTVLLGDGVEKKGFFKG